MAKNESLNTVFIDQLRDLYNEEHQSLTILPELIEKSALPKLVEVFEDHLRQTKTHIARLEQVFREIDENPGGERCQAMEGIIKEVRDVLYKYDDSEVRDAAIIPAVQRMEHYEMAGYGAVRNQARVLGHKDAADLLQQTLEEESEHDKQLTGLADGSLLSKGINKQAMS